MAMVEEGDEVRAWRTSSFSGRRDKGIPLKAEEEEGSQAGGGMAGRELPRRRGVGHSRQREEEERGSQGVGVGRTEGILASQLDRQAVDIQVPRKGTN